MHNARKVEAVNQVYLGRKLGLIIQKAQAEGDQERLELALSLQAEYHDLVDQIQATKYGTLQ